MIRFALFGALALASCTTMTAYEAAPTDKQVLVPDALTETYETLNYAPAVRAGDMLYLSGVIAELGDGETSTNITPAIERAFDEISLILAQANADWSDVVDVTSYMTDVDAQLDPLWAVKAARVPAPYPAWTVIGVSGLYGGEASLMEIKVTAYLPK